MKKKAVIRKRKKPIRKKLRKQKSIKDKKAIRKRKIQKVRFYIKLIYNFIKYRIINSVKLLIKIVKVFRIFFMYLINIFLFLLNIFFKIFTALITLLIVYLIVRFIIQENWIMVLTSCVPLGLIAFINSKIIGEYK